MTLKLQRIFWKQFQGGHLFIRNKYCKSSLRESWVLTFELEGCPYYLVPLQIIHSSEVFENDCSGWNWLGQQVSGLLPVTEQPRLGIQVLPHSGLQLLLHPWHKGAGLGHPGQGQEETKPIHHQEKYQAQGGVPEKEARPCTCGSCQASPASSLTNCFIRASPGDRGEERWNNAILLTTRWQCESLSSSHSSSSWNDILYPHPQPIGRVTLPYWHCWTQCRLRRLTSKWCSPSSNLCQLLRTNWVGMDEKAAKQHQAWVPLFGSLLGRGLQHYHYHLHINIVIVGYS